MTKHQFQYRFKHLEEKFYPSTDLGNYVIYKPENLTFYN